MLFSLITLRDKLFFDYILVFFVSSNLNMYRVSFFSILKVARSYKQFELFSYLLKFASKRESVESCLGKEFFSLVDQ